MFDIVAHAVDFTTDEGAGWFGVAFPGAEPPSTQVGTKPVLETDDWSRDREEMLVFAVRWAPYGGGNPEDIWTTFGISDRTYFLRLRALLEGPRRSAVDVDTWRRLQQLCTDRLANPKVV